MIRDALVTLLFCVLLWGLQITGVMAVGKDYCKTECFTMTPLAVQRRDACKIVYRVSSSCHLPHSINDGSSKIGESQVELGVEQACLTHHSSYCSNYQLNFMLNVLTANKIYMIIYGWGIDGKQHCSEITYEGRLGAAHSVLHVQCFKLPEGSYNVTVLEQEILNESEESLTVVIEDTPILLGHSYDKKLRRVKHNIHPGIDYTGSTQRAVVPNLYNCQKCLNLTHQYYPQTALLNFTYTIMDIEGCQGNCTEFTLTVLKYKNENDQKSCEARNFTSATIQQLLHPTPERNISSGPVTYENIDTGCYTFRLNPLAFATFPIYHGFFWFKSAINVTDMNDWNTTFYLKPNHKLKTLDIRWTAPEHPFNFSTYGLQLWYQHNVSINCQDNSLDLRINIIPENKIILHQTHYTFTNLSIGWYCARVTPMDDRCPLDGCEPRSSIAKKLIDIDEMVPEPEDSSTISPTLIGFLVTGIVLAIALACYLQRRKTTREPFHNSYSRVFKGNLLSDIQLVLLVWTRVGPGGEHLDPIMKAFREILTSYAHCKVYDYLDISSLPEDQQYQLFLNNTAWVDHILSHHNIKIILVGTEGARRSQVLSTSLCRASERLVQNDELASVDPLDITLFPYILRQLQDRPGLSSNYSRIFHVRFADITGEEGELDGVVTWARYKMPQHIRQLTLHLHGLTEEMAVSFSEPSAEMIRNLSEALAAYPPNISSDSCASSSASNKLNGVSASNSTKEPMSEVELALLEVLEVKRDEVAEKSELAEECSSIASDTSSPGMQVT
ncbi:uncharacterized protein LOC143038520 isoform X2 [Oratosquilla oratoria]|uniref:uncharacterized protein LOC143038520 isoform X2 n=1 Tax=Oratosquilla oratoria TaxID=337810 RepID=UPI003F7689D9